ncbi:hypothetical protein Peur_045428 [Populus x canadensis]
MRGARKFRHSGIDLALCCKYDIMFTNVVATDKYAWAPSQGLNSDDDGLGERRKNASNEDSLLEKGSSDSEENTLSNFIEDVNNMVPGVNFINSISNPSSSSVKRKGVQQCTQKSEKKKGSGMGAQLFLHLDRLVDSVSTRSECTSSDWEEKGCSIEEAMKEFHSIEEVIFDNEIYCFATIFSLLEARGKSGQQLEIRKENFNG